MITIEEVLKIHIIIIEKFGGTEGIRDKNILDSALNRPFQTFEGKDLYPTSIDKASALIESVVKNHPFIDGNKRTGYVLMRLLLLNNGLDIQATRNEKYEFVIAIANGKFDYEHIKEWIEKRLIKNEV